MTDIATIGHNGAPDPIDETLAEFSDAISEAENWLDGAKVETEAQMKAVDALAKQIRSARSAVDKARDEATKPLHEAWKGEVARWKPTQDDLDRLQKGLAKIVNDFKVAEKARRDAEEARKRAEAQAAAEAAHKASMEADEGDIESVRAADAAKREADIAQIEARKAAASSADVKGLRTVTRYEITDHRDLLNWIAVNCRDDVTAFIEGWARRNHNPDPRANGLRVWTEKAAY